MLGHMNLNFRRILRHARANAVAYLALFVALGSSGAVAATQLERGQVRTKHIKNKAVTTKKLKGKAVTNAKLRNDAVTTAKLRNKAVTTAKLADGAVGFQQLGAAAVTAGKIAAGAVGSSELFDGAVTSSKIAPGSVGSAELGDGQVASADLARPARLIEYAQPAGTTDVPILTAGDLRLRADCTVGGGGAVTLLIDAATSSGAGTIESSGMADDEGGGETTFVNGPIAVGPAFVGATSISDANVGAAGADGNYQLLYDGPGVAVNVEMTVAAFRAPGNDRCAASGIAVSAG